MPVSFQRPRRLSRELLLAGSPPVWIGGIEPGGFVAIVAARAAGVKQALAQNRDQLVIGAHHHAGMAVMAGLDGKGHGGDHRLLPVPPLHKAKGEIAARATQLEIVCAEQPNSRASSAGVLPPSSNSNICILNSAGYGKWLRGMTDFFLRYGSASIDYRHAAPCL